MSAEVEGPAGTALVEVVPGTAVVFGETPGGLDLIPFRLISPADQAAIGSAIAATSAVLNVGGQVATQLAQAQGLVRLAPQTLRALEAGARPIQSGGYNIGVLAAKDSGQFAAQVRWLPAGQGAQVAGVVASLGPAVAMIAIQVQLNEISGLVRENLALTETVLKSVRHEQWAELTGLEHAITNALAEANAVGHVTPLLWENISGYEADLRKQRDLFRRHVESHAAELAKRDEHKERRQYVEKNGEAVLLDLHSLLMAHKAWFEYQALRAGRARLSADDEPNDAKLLEAIVDNARREYDKVVEEMNAVLEPLNRELWILAELPGKRTIPFTKSRRSAADVARMAEELLKAVSRLSDSFWQQPAPLEPPSTVCVDEGDRLEQDLRILRWYLRPDEPLDAIATAGEVGLGGALNGLGVARRLGANGVLVAVTPERVLTADLSEFRNQGVVDRSVPCGEIRYVRFRDDDPAGQAEVDLITRTENLTWRFGKDSASESSVRRLAALLATRMEIPQVERDELLAALPAPSTESRQLTE